MVVPVFLLLFRIIIVGYVQQGDYIWGIDNNKNKVMNANELKKALLESPDGIVELSRDDLKQVTPTPADKLQGIINETASITERFIDVNQAATMAGAAITDVLFKSWGQLLTPEEDKMLRDARTIIHTLKMKTSLNMAIKYCENKMMK